MKTLLLILLLSSSTEIPSSKVADSPGAELLLRSDSPNRGGAILPDTFFKYPYESEISSSPLHSSGPWTVDGGPNLRSPVSWLPSQKGFSLVDDSISQGQEEGNTPAQPEEATPTDSLQVGDFIPDGLEFSNLLNTDTERIKLSDYRGKYVILQFWATWCTASSGYLIQAEEIQNHFGDQIQILPVTYESKAQVDKALSIRKSLGDLNLPLITQEEKLRGYFPHITLPHLVIINPEGKVIAITESKELSVPKLQTLLDTGVGSFRLKVDHRIPFDMEEKLISGNTQIPSKNIRFQSALTNYIPGVSGGSMESFEDGTHLLFVNISLIKLYRHAYTGRDIENYLGFNRIITKGFEAEELTTTKSGLDYREWMERGDRVFGYELLAPPGVDGYGQMREDLVRYFPQIQAKMELRPRMVWAMVQQEGKVYPKSQSAKRYMVQPGQASLRNSLLTGFIYQLNLYFMQRSPYPVINRTGIDYPIDIDLEANFSKPEELKAALNKVGLDLVLLEETIPVLILTKTENLNPLNP
jgi:thiol-disulfide isomerase/thioredoxin